MEKRYLSPEDAAPFLGLSAAAVRKYMRNGSMDLGMVLSPQKTGCSSVSGAVGSGRKKVHAQWKHGPGNGIKSSKDRD
nr:MAG TPA: Regulatory phage protein cox [Caudoviricetes sp.]